MGRDRTGALGPLGDPLFQYLTAREPCRRQLSIALDVRARHCLDLFVAAFRDHFRRLVLAKRILHAYEPDANSLWGFHLGDNVSDAESADEPLA